jgi:4-hydroxybenzoate polyprenyltransferase
MIRFPHTVFALPFALSGLTLASFVAPVTFPALAWVLVAMVGARSAAMGFNRIADRGLDARNPRTRDRELPSGKISVAETWVLVTLSAAAFLVAASRLNPLCARLAPLALAWILFYSITKRFTWASHYVLGLSLAIAPVGGWLAVTGAFHPVPLLLALGVLAWVAGFDIFYSLQDLAFDREAGLHSVPARFGVPGAIRIARASHLVTILALLGVAGLLPLGWPYVIGVLGVAALLLYEHSLVRPGDLSRLDRAFFDMNGLVSVVYFAATLAAALFARGGGR